VTRPATIAPLVDQVPAPLREYIETLERVAGDDFRVDRIGASHAGDPETSSDAARFNFPRSGNQRRHVLEALAARTNGATFEQLIADTGIRSAAKRLTELKAGGWAFATGSTRPTSQGGSAEVYLASKRALQELERDRRAHTTADGAARSSSLGAARPSADHKTAGGGTAAALPSEPLGSVDEGVAIPDAPSPADPSPLVGFDAAIEVGGTHGRPRSKGPYDCIEEDAA
jgi:hypothetical protein